MRKENVCVQGGCVWKEDVCARRMHVHKRVCARRIHVCKEDVYVLGG